MDKNAKFLSAKTHQPISKDFFVNEDFYIEVPEKPVNQYVGLKYSTEYAVFYFYRLEYAPMIYRPVQNLIRADIEEVKGIEWYLIDEDGTSTPAKEEMIEIPVAKHWKDDEGKIDSIHVSLLSEGHILAQQTLRRENEWKTSFFVPLKDVNGHEISYDIVEAPVPEGYKSEVTGNTTDGFTITNTKVVPEVPSDPTPPGDSTPPSKPTPPDDSTPPSRPIHKEPKSDRPSKDPDLLSITVVKKWTLDDGGRAASVVTAVLMKDGVEWKTAELNEANGWTYTWNDLSRNHTWTVAEKAVPDGFTSSVTRNGSRFIITNDDMPKPPVPVPASAIVTKQWITDNGGIAGSSATVVLMKDGMVEDTVVLTHENNWTYSWSGLDGNCTWTVDEVNVPAGFQHSVMEENGVFTVTNDDVPTVPDTPDRPDASDKPESPDHVPKTHDNSRVLMWLMLSFGFTSGGVILLIFRKRSPSHRMKGN